MMANNHNPVHIFPLNDYCLESICKFLTLPDQLNFALSCQRFSATLSSFYRAKFKDFNLSILKGLPLAQKSTFLHIVNPQIKTLTANFGNVPYFMQRGLAVVLETFLTDVEKFTVYEGTPLVFPNLFKNMYSLQELILISGDIRGEVLNKYLRELKTLKALHIYNGNSIDFDISKLTRLEKLTLHCSQYGSSKFKLICENLTNLTHLDIRVNYYTEYYEHIAEHLLQLRTLKISCDRGNFNCLAFLPNLKILNIRFLNPDYAQIEDFFTNLANHQAHQLEELDIFDLTLNMEIATSISKLNKLKVLKCTFPGDEEVMEKFYNLKELEEVDFNPPFTDNAVLQLLNNCFQLKKVRLWHTTFDTVNMSRICDIIERHNEQARQTGGQLIKSQSKYETPLNSHVGYLHKCIVLEF